MAFTFPSFRGSSTFASLPLLFLLLLLSSITLTFAQWTLIGDFEPGRGSDQQRQMAMDKWQGKTSVIQMFFTSWNTQEMEWMWKSLADIYSQGHIPIISWEPWQFEGKTLIPVFTLTFTFSRFFHLQVNLPTTLRFSFLKVVITPTLTPGEDNSRIGWPDPMDNGTLLMTEEHICVSLTK
jgi:hypothetical protein